MHSPSARALSHPQPLIHCREEQSKNKKHTNRN